MIYDQPPAPIVVCLDCSPHERIALNFLQEKRKIRNINALAVVMGNIKQESRFDHLICEGGQRTGYKKCHSGISSHHNFYSNPNTTELSSGLIFLRKICNA